MYLLVLHLVVDGFWEVHSQHPCPCSLLLSASPILNVKNGLSKSPLQVIRGQLKFLVEMYNFLFTTNITFTSVSS